ncbi:cell division cycle protein 20 homolog [Ptychodera flava]|uniref:cell division cycle protein 20 homolog n=1 Tax=Ptychodera flava TaxID=63121 RepID=UPI00396A4231
MAHFQFETSVNELVRLDGPVGGPMPRWQRKEKQQKERICSGNANSLSLPMSPSRLPLQKTPKRTPKKSPRSAKSPNGSKSPKCKSTSPIMDRFIPNRSTMDMERSHFLLTHPSGIENEAGDGDEDDDEDIEAKQNLATALNGDSIADAKILSFKNKAPRAAEGYYNNLRVLYSSSSKVGVPQAKSTRYIPTRPDFVLDAPELLNDFYLTLVDWGHQNIIAATLGRSVYLWSANTGVVRHLVEVPAPDYISSVRWLPHWSTLAVGVSSGDVQLWDVDVEKKLRCMSGHAGRISSLSWNSYILSSGSNSGRIHNHDVRIQNHHIATLGHHEQDVCGLAWNSPGRLLASGGNDDTLNIWDARSTTDSQPLHSLTEHTAAVKAIGWCPWQSNLLASGGGTADRTIRFWNCDTGLCLNTIDTGSQVSGILWSREYKELVSSHGYKHNQLSIWKYPTMKKVVDLKNHRDRILCMALSPDEENVVTAGGDETFQIWKCFKADRKSKKSANANADAKKDGGMPALTRSIR